MKPKPNYLSGHSKLVANYRQNHRNIVFKDQQGSETVGIRLADGEFKIVPWLGFIERRDARKLKSAKPVRLVWFSRVGYENIESIEWQDMPPDSFLHGCLTSNGAYAVYDATIAVIED